MKVIKAPENFDNFTRKGNDNSKASFLLYF